MDPEVVSLSKHTVPRVDYRVRRRRYGETPMLLYHNDWYELDGVSDTIWLACEESLTIEQIAQRVVERHDLKSNEALAAVIFTLEVYRGLGFVTWDERPAP